MKSLSPKTWLLLLGVFLSPGSLFADSAGSDGKRNGMAVIVAFPEKNIPLPTDPTIWNKLAHFFDFDRDGSWRVGHAGILLINKENGRVEYVDFGRYDNRRDLPEKRPENFGVVRAPSVVPELDLEVKAQLDHGYLENLDSLLVYLAAKEEFEDYGRIEAAVYDDLNFPRMKAFIDDLKQKGYIKYGCPTQQYCSRFARQVVRRGGGRYGFGVYTGMQMVKWTRKKVQAN